MLKKKLKCFLFMKTRYFNKQTSTNMWGYLNALIRNSTNQDTFVLKIKDF